METLPEPSQSEDYKELLPPEIQHLESKILSTSRTKDREEYLDGLDELLDFARTLTVEMPINLSKKDFAQLARSLGKILQLKQLLVDIFSTVKENDLDSLQDINLDKVGEIFLDLSLFFNPDRLSEFKNYLASQDPPPLLIKDLDEFFDDVFVNNLDLVQEIIAVDIQNQDQVKIFTAKRGALAALNAVSETSLDDKKVDKAYDILEVYWNRVSQDMFRLGDNTDNSHIRWLDYYKNLLYERPEFRAVFKESLKKMIGSLEDYSGIPTFVTILSWEYEYFGFDEVIIGPLRSFLGNFGIGEDRAKKFAQKWRAGISHDPGRFKYSAECVQSTIASIKILEHFRPGSVKALNEQFNIFHFGRYNTEMLRDQYDNRESQQDYGTVLFANSDHNNAFYDDADILKGLSDDLAKMGILIRIVEASSKIDAFRMLSKLDQKYGSGHKMSFAVVGGHGTECSLEFGDRYNLDVLRVSDLADTRRDIGRIQIFFKDNAIFILISCSTGIDGGLADQLAQKLDKIVVGPNRDTGLKSLRAYEEGGELKIDVEYGEGVEAKVYRGAKES